MAVSQGGTVVEMVGVVGQPQYLLSTVTVPRLGSMGCTAARMTTSGMPVAMGSMRSPRARIAGVGTSGSLPIAGEVVES